MSGRRLLPTALIGLLFGLTLSLAFVSPALAQEEGRTETEGFVRCTSTFDTKTKTEEGTGCDICELFKLVNNITTYAAGFLGMITTAMIVIAGFIYVSSAGNEVGITKAKRTFQWAIVGFTIAILSLITVKTAVFILLNGSDQDATAQNPISAVFGTFECKGLPSPDDPGGPPLTGEKPVDPPSDPTCKGENQRRCNDDFNECRNANLTQQMVNCLEQVGAGWVITSTYSGCHDVNSCHFGGRNCTDGSHAIDMDISGGPITQTLWNFLKGQISQCSGITGAGVVNPRLERGSQTVTDPTQADHVHMNVFSGACGCN